MKSVAGGIWILVGVVGGMVAGMALGEPSMGLFAGLALGLALAAFVTIRDFMREKKRGE